MGGAKTTAATLVLLSACSAPAPYGETLIVVDTDLPVPELAARLRVDVYKEDGVWLESRDFVRVAAEDWPVSFGVFTSDEDRESRALVRLRVYPEARVRDYRGERFWPRTPDVEPFIANTPEELCANELELPLGHTVLQRRGWSAVRNQFCGYYPAGGSTAAFVNISEAGTYRFEVLKISPAFHQVGLELRRECEEKPGNPQCDPGLVGLQAVRPKLIASLEPGRYHLITAGMLEDGAVAVGYGPTDLVLAAALADRWNELDPTPINAPPAEPLPPTPMWLRGTADLTPESEPEPSITSDRLIALRFVPGEVSTTRVTLRGACMGNMADIGAGVEEQRANIDAAHTCVDQDGVLVPASEVPQVQDDSEPSAQGTFAFEEPWSGSREFRDSGSIATRSASAGTGRPWRAGFSHLSSTSPTKRHSRHLGLGRNTRTTAPGATPHGIARTIRSTASRGTPRARSANSSAAIYRRRPNGSTSLPRRGATRRPPMHGATSRPPAITPFMLGRA